MGKHSDDNPSRLADWGNSLLNKLQARTRKRRKRHASKRRRVAERKRIESESCDKDR